jgi:hypothetical protein
MLMLGKPVEYQRRHASLRESDPTEAGPMEISVATPKPLSAFRRRPAANTHPHFGNYVQATPSSVDIGYSPASGTSSGTSAVYGRQAETDDP